MKKVISSAERSHIRLDERMAEDGVADELDATDFNSEDILASAAKKAKKEDLPAVDHSRLKYESFREEFYMPPPDIAAMSDEEAVLLTFELDGIKIRGVDCLRPVTKWSYFRIGESHSL